MRIISRLDIKQNDLIKAVMFDGVRKVGQPADFAKTYYDNNIDELMLINNTGSLYNTKLDRNIIEVIRNDKAIPISGGGGINTYEDSMHLIESGCDKVVINTLIHRNKKEVKKIIDTLGSSSVTGAIQFEKRDGKLISLFEMARETNFVTLNETLRIYEDLGIGEVLLTDVSRDGCYSGLNPYIQDEINNFYNKMPILLGGGFFNKKEFNLYKGLLSGIVISSAFHYQKVNLNDIIDYRNNIIY